MRISRYKNVYGENTRDNFNAFTKQSIWMKGIKNTIGVGISTILLLCFLVNILPVDFLHSHTVEKITCQDAKTNQPCKHANHVSTAKSFCWVCAIHINASFAPEPVLNKILASPAVSIFAESEVTGYFVEYLFSALRGPPQN
jgi:hypothetical protein